MSAPNLHLPPPWPLGGLVPLPPEKAHHALHVLRLAAGDPVRLQDGLGHVAPGVFEPVGKRDAGVRVTGEATAAPEVVHPLELILALPRHETMDTVIRQACELGVARLRPVISARSVVPARVARQKSGHWEKVMIAACEQSGRARHLELLPARPLDAVLDDLPAGTRRLFFWEEAPARHAPWGVVPGRPVAAAIGPEGGWTAAEAEAFAAAGFDTRSLGGLILRVDTAVAAVVAITEHLLHLES
jgi:16S rRNA (uracil1498-N3)-methyltransferase